MARSFAAAAVLGAIAGAAPAGAQLFPASTQFDLTGFLQVATLDAACASNAHCGGSLRVNGQSITVPNETIVILPANALTWQELFAQAPAPYGLSASVPASGLAMADAPAPLTTYEVHVVGNRVTSAPGGDQYIAGLVWISQHSLNSGSGYINFIDYGTGELRVGGILGDATTGTRVRINDPVGRFGRASSPDGRFTVDSENPTITAGTGYPMCIPRAAPAAAGSPEADPLCPQGNRPVLSAGPPAQYLSAFTMNNPDNPATLGLPPNPFYQAPMEVGDFITFAGTLVADGATPTAGPWPGIENTYVSAHTIEDNVAIYTFPGTSPAYVRVDVSLMGTGGLTVAGAAEAANRTRFEGMTTDPSRPIHLFGIDLNATTGATADRDYGMIGVDPGPPTGAVKGRWRYRPPCTGTFPTDRICTPPPAGTFLPAPREVRAVIQGEWDPGQVITYANGIIAGQYHAPIAEYIFPENVPGTPIVSNNFNSMPFLSAGGYSSSAGTIAKRLDPWPDATTPSATCTPPVAQPGGPYTAGSGSAVTIAGGASGTAPFVYTWAAPASGSLSSLTVAGPVYTAPLVAQQTSVPLSLTVVNGCGSSTASTTVVVSGAGVPVVNPVAAVSVLSGANASLTATGADPQGLPLTFAWTQTASTGPTVLNPNFRTGATLAFTAPALPLGQVTPYVLNFIVTATNSAGVVSAPVSASITVNPLPDSVVITATEFRTSKVRLTINATSSVVSPNVVLTLRPYLTTLGNTFDPSGLGNVFTNNGGGLYVLTLVGAPEPALPPAAPLVVESNLGGVSPPHGLDRIRQ